MAVRDHQTGGVNACMPRSQQQSATQISCNAHQTRDQPNLHPINWRCTCVPRGSALSTAWHELAHHGATPPEKHKTQPLKQTNHTTNKAFNKTAAALLAAVFLLLAHCAAGASAEGSAPAENDQTFTWGSGAVYNLYLQLRKRFMDFFMRYVLIDDGTWDDSVWWHGPPVPPLPTYWPAPAPVNIGGGGGDDANIELNDGAPEAVAPPFNPFNGSSLAPFNGAYGGGGGGGNNSSGDSYIDTHVGSYGGGCGGGNNCCCGGDCAAQTLPPPPPAGTACRCCCCCWNTCWYAGCCCVACCAGCCAGCACCTTCE